jgi:hypothetical protein
LTLGVGTTVTDNGTAAFVTGDTVTMTGSNSRRRSRSPTAACSPPTTRCLPRAASTPPALSR